MPAYKLQGERKFHGLDIAIENLKGSERKWYDPHGKEAGSTHMHCDYGYIRGSEGTDGDHVDVYVGPVEEVGLVFIVNQMKKPAFKEFDEQKCMIGFKDADAAKAAYLRQYNDPKFFGSMKAMPFEEFKMKVLDKKNRGVKIAMNPNKTAALSPAVLSALQHGGIGAGLGAVAGGIGGAAHAGPDHRGQGALRGALVGAGLGAAGGTGIAAIKGHGAQQLATLQNAAHQAEQSAVTAHRNASGMAATGLAPSPTLAKPAGNTTKQVAVRPLTMGQPNPVHTGPAPYLAPSAVPARSPIDATKQFDVRPLTQGMPDPRVVGPVASPGLSVAQHQASAAGAKAEALNQAARTLGQQQGAMNQTINRAGLVGAAAGTGLMGYMAVPGQYGGPPQQPVKTAVSAAWIREKAIGGLAKRGIVPDSKSQRDLARKAVAYAQAKELGVAGEAGSELMSALKKMKDMGYNARGSVGRPRPAPPSGTPSAAEQANEAAYNAYRKTRQRGGQGGHPYDNQNEQKAYRVVGNLGLNIGIPTMFAQARNTRSTEHDEKNVKRRLKADKPVAWSKLPDNRAAAVALATLGTVTGGAAGVGLGSLWGARSNAGRTAVQGGLLGLGLGGSLGISNARRVFDSHKRTQDLRDKDAKEHDNSDLQVGAGGALALGGAGMVSSSKPLVTGRTSIYHGTTEALAEKVRQDGLRPSASIAKGPAITDILPNDIRAQAKNLVYLTPDKREARGYAGQAKALAGLGPDINYGSHETHQARVRGIRQAQANPFQKGVVHAEVPMWRQDIASKLKANPEARGSWEAFQNHHDPLGLNKHFNPRATESLRRTYDSLARAVSVEGGIAPEFIHGAKYKGVGLQELGQYIKARPKQFMQGAGLAGAGVGALAGGAYLAGSGVRKKMRGEEKTSSEDRVARTADRLDDLGIGLLAAPSLAAVGRRGFGAMMGAGKSLMQHAPTNGVAQAVGGGMRNLGGRGAVLAGRASDAMHHFGPHHGLELAGLALVAPGVTHALAKRLTPATAAEKVGQLLAGEKTAAIPGHHTLIEALHSGGGAAVGAALGAATGKSPEATLGGGLGGIAGAVVGREAIHRLPLALKLPYGELSPPVAATLALATPLVGGLLGSYAGKALTKNAGLAGALWANKKPIAGALALGTVGAGLYGAKKVVDQGKDMVNSHHHAASYVGVPPGMAQPAF